MTKLLKDLGRGDPCPVHPKKERPHQPVNTPVSGQFDLDDDLEADVYNPLETPTDMPIQDKSVMPVKEDVQTESVQSSAVTPAEDHMLDKVDDNMSVTSSSQER